jgi:ABC-2 type transport system permease protein
MAPLTSALWAESLKALRSKVPFFTALGFSLVPVIGGFLMIILKDPAAARSMGLISMKAQLTAGTADWPAYFSLLAQATAVGGAFVFSIFTTWIFGRELSDHTAKEFLAIRTPRSATISAKFVLTVVWSLILTLLLLSLGLIVGRLVDIPGYSRSLLLASVGNILGSGILTITLLPYIALLASAGRGYLPAFGWLVLTTVLAQVAAFTGWGDWFPWSIPALFSGGAGPRAGLLGPHSYVVLAVACLIGTAATFLWWRDADQTR